MVRRSAGLDNSSTRASSRRRKRDWLTPDAIARTELGL
jgi:hypothetical protein